MNLRMPAEWEPHAKTWMGWPRRPDNWRDGATHARKAFAAVAKAISEFEPVVVAVNDGDEQSAREILGTNPNVRIERIPHDDSWFRDMAPTFVHDSKGLRGIDWTFNAWGGLYDSWDQDQRVAEEILKTENVRRTSESMVLEGGSIHVDGEGTLLTTEECLLNSNRNPGMTTSDIERKLKDAFGVTKVIWLPRGLVADEDTNGHVDNIACFAAPGKVLLAWTDDESDPQYAISTQAYDVLSKATDARGRRMEIIKMPLPPAQYITEEEARGTFRLAGERMAASYVNFYIVNGGVIVPGFGTGTDAIAKDVLQRVFPDRRVVQIPTREILLGGGNIHCITMQQPVGKE